MLSLFQSFEGFLSFCLCAFVLPSLKVFQNTNASSYVNIQIYLSLQNSHIYTATHLPAGVSRGGIITERMEKKESERRLDYFFYHHFPFLLPPIPHSRNFSLPHFLLQLQNSIHERFTSGWASRNINVYRDNPVASPDDTV